MRGRGLDWRWVGLIVVVALLANGHLIPWPVTALLLLGGGGYLLFVGWQVWSGTSNPFQSTRVTYWRGQRIEVKAAQGARGIPPLRAVGPAVVYLVIGAALLLGGIAVLVGNVFS